MRRLGLLCAALGLLAACAGDPAPIEPTRKATATAGAGSTLQPPTLPPAAERNDETGAANFVLYWVRVFNYASHTGDTALLAEITDSSCGGCQRYIRLYEKTYARGGYFKGSDWRLSQVSVERGIDGSLVLAHVSAPEGEFRESARSAVEHGNDEDSDLAFGVRWLDGSWRMTQLGLQSELAS